MDNQRLTYLLHCYFQDIATDDQRDEMTFCLDEDNSEDVPIGVMDELWIKHHSSGALFSVEKSESILAQILNIKAYEVQWTFQPIASLHINLIDGIIQIPQHEEFFTGR